MNFKGLLVSSVALMGLTACGANNNGAPIQSSGDGIVGGKIVLREDAIAKRTALLYDTKQGSICTVSILSKEWVLTAAHCVEGSDKDSLAIVFETDINGTKTQDGQRMRKATRRVMDVHAHPHFAETMANLEALEAKAQAENRELSSEDIDKVTDWGDVALIRLDGTIPETHKPVEMLPGETELTKGLTVTLAGYGITSGGPLGAGSGTLRKVDVTIAEAVWGTTEVLMDQTNRKGACHGDSGGPAYVGTGEDLKLFGVTSRGVRDNEDTCTQFAAYTNIQSYRPWIKQVSGL